jgi:uncharacterized protein YndB with AHSA1/START domain
MPDALSGAIPEAHVSKSLLVDCPQEHAFRVFTQHMGSWWPATHHIGALPFTDIVIEPRAGGRWYELNANGVEGAWGHVLAWDPPRELVLSWHLNTKFEFVADLDQASRLEIRFLKHGVNQTRIEFAHWHIERHGEGYQGLRDQLDNGWVGVLAELAKLAEAPASQLASCR